MNLSKHIIVGLLALVLVGLPMAGSAQTSSINAFSPYSMYGLGEINTQGTLQMRAMGGAGVAQRLPSAVNTLNPASYSSTLQRSFLFNFGVDGAYYKNTQNKYSAEGTSLSKTGYGTFNFQQIALQFPITRGLGVGLSLNPYSSVGYRMKTYDDQDEIWGDVGRVQYAYDGEGDVTEVKLGVGWEVFKHFSIGAAVQYYWGEIDRNYSTKVLNNYGEGAFSSTVGNEAYYVSRFKAQFGLQWNVLFTKKNILTLGATYDLGGNLNPKISNKVYIDDTFSSEVTNVEQRLELRLPSQISAGIYYQNPKVSVAADYTYQDWAKKNSRKEIIANGFEVAYADTHTIKAGVEYTPNIYDARRYMRRVHYRVGFRYGDYYQTFQNHRLNQYAITAGLGFPLKFMGMSSIDVSFEYGSRGDRTILQLDAKRLGLVRQNYFKFAVGFSMFGEDYWFVRPKFD